MHTILTSGRGSLLGATGGLPATDEASLLEDESKFINVDGPEYNASRRFRQSDSIPSSRSKRRNVENRVCESRGSVLFACGFTMDPI